MWRLCSLGLCLLSFGKAQETCSVVEGEMDSALREMTYDVGDGEERFLAYVQPDVTSFYKDEPPASKKVMPKHNGLAGKFINMSNKHVTLYWEPYAGGKANFMRHYSPWSSGGTATFPGHRFFLTPDDDPKERLAEFVIGEYPDSIHIYDPYLVEGNPEQTQANLAALSASDRYNWEQWNKTRAFDAQYRAFTGRRYLSNYLRKPPQHFMWRADYFGQEHWVTTKETHFQSLPDSSELKPITEFGGARILSEEEPRLLQEHRAHDGIMNMTLRVLSCAPRVFEIPNFLSKVEVDHILDLARKIDLKESTTGFHDKNPKDVAKSSTRTSFNSWVPREQTPVIDAIYRRSADLLRMDEAMLRRRGPGEIPNLETKNTVAEALQLVHYDLTQEYTAHHDFGYNPIENEKQGARFATLLFYLNEGMVGGETSFPRWINAETFHELKVTPEVGKAVLFYSQLPDGNMDDFSQHAALPIKSGEKWLINLWVWDPYYEK